VQLYRALGYDVPQFGHLPLILGPDKKRLSKRHGATAIGEYQIRGYLPSALVNYLALLGWSPGGDREIMTMDELIEAFDIRRVLKKSAVFDEEKLRWINGQHIRRLSISELMERLRPYIDGDVPGGDNGYLERVVRLMQERMAILPDLFNEGWFFFKDPESYDEKGVRKHWKPHVPGMVEEILAELEQCDFTAASIEEVIRSYAERQGVSAGKIIHPLRLAVTGRTASPGLFETMELLGKETVLRRLRKALETLPRTPEGTVTTE